MGITYQSDVEGIKHDQVAEGYFMNEKECARLRA